MKNAIVSILLAISGLPCFGLQVSVEGWAVTNYFSNDDSAATGQNSIQIDVVLTLDQPVARLVKVVGLTGKVPGLSLRAEVADFKIESERSLKVRFNKWNVYSEENRYYVPAGICTVGLTLADGKTVTCAIELTSPNDPKHLADSFVESLGGRNQQDTNSVSVLPVPKISSLELTSTGLRMGFDVDDSRVFSGVIQLHDQEGRLVGVSPAFVDFKTGSSTRFLNSGNTLDTSGNLNVVDFPAESFLMRPNRTLSETSELLLIVTDGQQFLGVDVPSWDFMAVRRVVIAKQDGH